MALSVFLQPLFNLSDYTTDQESILKIWSCAHLATLVGTTPQSMRLENLAWRMWSRMERERCRKKQNVDDWLLSPLSLPEECAGAVEILMPKRQQQRRMVNGDQSLPSFIIPPCAIQILSEVQEASCKHRYQYYKHQHHHKYHHRKSKKNHSSKMATVTVSDAVSSSSEQSANTSLESTKLASESASTLKTIGTISSTSTRKKNVDSFLSSLSTQQFKNPRKSTSTNNNSVASAASKVSPGSTTLLAASTTNSTASVATVERLQEERRVAQLQRQTQETRLRQIRQREEAEHQFALQCDMFSKVQPVVKPKVNGLLTNLLREASMQQQQQDLLSQQPFYSNASGGYHFYYGQDGLLYMQRQGEDYAYNYAADTSFYCPPPERPAAPAPLFHQGHVLPPSLMDENLPELQPHRSLHTSGSMNSISKAVEIPSPSRMSHINQRCTLTNDLNRSESPVPDPRLSIPIGESENVGLGPFSATHAIDEHYFYRNIGLSGW